MGNWELDTVFVLIVTALGLRYWWTVRRLQRRAAQRLLSQHKAIYGDEPHEFQIVSPADFPQLDREFYDRCRAWFEANGFRFLCDRENLTFSRLSPERRTFIRSMVSDDGTILAGVWHVKTTARGFPPDIKTVALETEFSDGTFITTGNTLEVVRTLPVPGIDALRCPHDTSPDELLRTHRERLTEAFQVKPFLSATRIKTIEECIYFQQRMHAVSSKHKRAVGYLGAADLEKVKGRKLNSLERGMVRELDKLKDAEKQEEAGWSS